MPVAVFSILVVFELVRIVSPRLVRLFCKRRRDLFVFAGEDPVQQLDDGDLGSDRVVEVAEFEPDRAAAQDQHRFGLGRQRHRLFVGDDRLAVEVERREAGGAGRRWRSRSIRR